MKSCDLVKCSCKIACSRATKRGQCPCCANGTACTYLCTCGYGNVPCSNRYGEHSDDDVVDQLDEDDPSFDDDKELVSDVLISRSTL